MWFWLFLAKQGSVWSGFSSLKAFFSVQLQNLLKARGKTSWFCFLSVLFSITFSFSLWKNSGSSMLLLNILNVVLMQPFSEMGLSPWEVWEFPLQIEPDPERSC